MLLINFFMFTFFCKCRSKGNSQETVSLSIMWMVDGDGMQALKLGSKPVYVLSRPASPFLFLIRMSMFLGVSGHGGARMYQVSFLIILHFL